jgi:AMP deaminase
VPTLKPAKKREPTPFDEVEVPTDKLDVIAKMVDGVFQVLPAQQMLRVDSSDSVDREPSLFVETGGHEYQPSTQPSTPYIQRLKREGAALVSSSSVGSLTRTSSTSTLDGGEIVVAVSLAEFVKDMRTLMRTLESGPVNSLCNDRMKMLEAKFELYHLQMKEVEDQRLKSVPHRDFFNVRKVDTHVHHSSCMTQRALLDFIKQKLVQDDKKKSQDRDIVHVEPKPKDGQPSQMTLTQVFQSLSLSAYDLSRDTLDMHADRTLWHRFDKFNLKYNPFGKSMLRQIFLKTDNVMNGRFLAEITRGVFKDLEDSKCAVPAQLACCSFTRVQVSACRVPYQHLRQGCQRVGQSGEVGGRQPPGVPQCPLAHSDSPHFLHFEPCGQSAKLRADAFQHIQAAVRNNHRPF